MEEGSLRSGELQNLNSIFAPFRRHGGLLAFHLTYLRINPIGSLNYLLNVYAPYHYALAKSSLERRPHVLIDVRNVVSCELSLLVDLSMQPRSSDESLPAASGRYAVHEVTDEGESPVKDFVSASRGPVCRHLHVH